MAKLRTLLEQLRSSLWFLPTIMVLAAVTLAIGLVEIDTYFALTRLKSLFPKLFGAGAEGTRGMLEAIASSMITVAGVAFSITIVALVLASSQYTSRIQRNFMRDRTNQFVLGAFVSIYVYCLVVLRTIRSGDEGAFVPSLAVLMAILLAFFGIACLIFFIHHIASSIQAESILRGISGETLRAVERLFPSELGKEYDQSIVPNSIPTVWHPVSCTRTGYLLAVDGEGLISIASNKNVMIRMERGIGKFIVKGAPLLSISGECSDDLKSQLNRLFSIGHQRTMLQDAGFGIRQIVDVALKALSPGINDTTTAVACLHYLTAIFVELASRHFESDYRVKDGQLLVIAKGPTFSDFVSQGFDQIRQNSAGNVAVLISMVEALTTISHATRSSDRRLALHRQAEAVSTLARHSVPIPEDRQDVERPLATLLNCLQESAGGTVTSD